MDIERRKSKEKGGSHSLEKNDRDKEKGYQKTRDSYKDSEARES